MTKFHANLTEERWRKLSFFEQMANIGAEVGRAIKWKEKDLQRSQNAFDSALELLDLTIGDPKNQKRATLLELCRVREVLVDYFLYDNIYGSSDKKWNDYFYGFTYAAALQRGS